MVIAFSIKQKKIFVLSHWLKLCLLLFFNKILLERQKKMKKKSSRNFTNTVDGTLWMNAKKNWKNGRNFFSIKKFLSQTPEVYLSIKHQNFREDFFHPLPGRSGIKKGCFSWKDRPPESSEELGKKKPEARKIQKLIGCMRKPSNLLSEAIRERPTK